MGRAINKAVTIAEILKRKMPLHQVNCLSSTEIVDVFEPIEEGLDVVESKRYVSCMTITLSTSLEGIDVNDIGYQVRVRVCVRVRDTIFCVGAKKIQLEWKRRKHEIFCIGFILCLHFVLVLFPIIHVSCARNLTFLKYFLIVASASLQRIKRI